MHIDDLLYIDYAQSYACPSVKCIITDRTSDCLLWDVLGGGQRFLELCVCQGLLQSARLGPSEQLQAV
eukprot:scaffold159018_cov20-Prasinocladus_malaysianus.AAC.1